MSRRSRSFNDPTARLATSENALLREVLDSLSLRETRILEMRFGMADGERKTLEEVGREFGVTRERIRQIEMKALCRLKHPSRRRQLVVDTGASYINVRRMVFPQTPTSGAAQCGSCQEPLQRSPLGRPRKFCSDRCRQAAYRLRVARRQSASRDDP